MKISIFRTLFRFFVFLAVTFVTGCATGPKFAVVDKVPDGKALIYLYRMFNVGGVASTHAIFANGELITALDNASYYPYIVSPGKVIFSSRSESPSALINLVNSKDHLLTINAVSGQTYYAEFHIGDTWGPKLILVPQDVGANRLQKCHLAD